MSLYIRLFNNFWTHKKTMRLRFILNNDAFWILPRLWSYASENEPSGDFTSYKPEEIAMAIGYFGDAQALLQALQETGFMDGMKIHDWEEHNEYHHAFSEKARKAAKARWNKNDKIGKEKKRKDQALLKHCSSIAPSITVYDVEFQRFWDNYPKKVAKVNAEGAWKKLKPEAELIQKILDDLMVKRASKDWTKEGGQFIPYPAKYLKERRWEEKIDIKNKLTQPVSTMTTEEINEREKQRYLREAEEQRKTQKTSLETVQVTQ